MNARGNGMTFNWLLHVLAVVAIGVFTAVLWVVARQELSS